VCVCASVHMRAARVQQGDILRILPRSQKPSSNRPSTPSPCPQCKQRAWPRRRTPPPALLCPSDPLLPNSRRFPPTRKARACTLLQAACKSEQSRCPGAARAAPASTASPSPGRTKAVVPLPLVLSESGPPRKGAVPSLSSLGFSSWTWAPGRWFPRVRFSAWGLPPAG
jgi:hypothetical protein